MDPLVLTDFFRFSHLLVVAIGFGGAFMADFMVLSRLGGRVDNALISHLHFAHLVVWNSLVAMWLTGAIMIFIRTGFLFDNFSPKLFSKLIVVSVLTANAVVIGSQAMPLVERCAGQSILTLPLRQKLLMAVVGSLSTISWILGLAFGVSKVFAAADWSTFGIVLPAAYLASVSIAVAGMTALHFAAPLLDMVRASNAKTWHKSDVALVQVR